MEPWIIQALDFWALESLILGALESWSRGALITWSHRAMEPRRFMIVSSPVLKHRIPYLNGNYFLFIFLKIFCVMISLKKYFQAIASSLLSLNLNFVEMTVEVSLQVILRGRTAI